MKLTCPRSAFITFLQTFALISTNTNEFKTGCSQRFLLTSKVLSKAVTAAFTFIAITSVPARASEPSYTFPAPSQSSSTEVTRVNFCNYLGGTIYMAYAYVQSSDTWRSKGWLDIPSGRCDDVVIPNYNDRPYQGNVIVYGRILDSQPVWTGFADMCVSSDTSHSWTSPYPMQSWDFQCSGDLVEVLGTKFRVRRSEINEFPIGP